MHGTVLIVVSQHHAVRKQTFCRAEAQRVLAVLLPEVLATVVQVLLHHLHGAEETAQIRPLVMRRNRGRMSPAFSGVVPVSSGNAIVLETNFNPSVTCGSTFGDI